MNHHDTRWLDRAVGNLVAENEESIGGASPSAFAILPMPWVCDSCQSPANAQQALYLLASQQAEIAGGRSRAVANGFLHAVSTSGIKPEHESESMRLSMMSHTYTSNGHWLPRDADAATEAVLTQIRGVLQGLRFGSITIIVQDGVVMQIDRTEKRRLQPSAAAKDAAESCPHCARNLYVNPRKENTMPRRQTYSDIVQTTFDTPLVHLGQLIPPGHATVLLKLEFFNPFASVKDRIGRAMIEAAEKAGVDFRRHRNHRAHQRQHGHCPSLRRRSQTL